MIELCVPFMRRILVSILLAGMVSSMTGCAGVKIVHLPIPVPTFGLGKKTDKPKTERRSAPPADVDVTMREEADFEVVEKGRAGGLASWYGNPHHGKRTASGEKFNMYAMTAAHRTLPFDTRVRVYNIENGKSAVVRINDRGPFLKGRIIDVSRAAAKKLDFVNDGIAQVEIEVVD